MSQETHARKRQENCIKKECWQIKASIFLYHQKIRGTRILCQEYIYNSRPVVQKAYANHSTHYTHTTHVNKKMKIIVIHKLYIDFTSLTQIALKYNESFNYYSTM
jgi:hypothetical protein